MPVQFDDSLARLQSDLTSNSAAAELLVDITNASPLSADTLARLAIACGNDKIANNINKAIQGLAPLSLVDLSYLSSALTDGNVALKFASMMAGGIKDVNGNVVYPSAPTAQVATPTFSPVAGSYTGTQSVVVSCATPGVSMYYTVNGSAPTTSSTLYSGPISVAASETVKVLAVKSGFINSAIASAAYVIS